MTLRCMVAVLAIAETLAILSLSCPCSAAVGQAADQPSSDEEGFKLLFDGKTLDGWNGDMTFWRVQDGAIVGGNLTEKVEHNQFLCTDERFSDFELRLEFKLVGDRTNGGVQIRSERIPDHFEVKGYQADLGDGWWGCLYDESRRRRILAGPKPEDRAKPVRLGQWNDYRIRCEGPRIRLWINGIQTVDYTEQEQNIPQQGVIAVQVHGNLVMEGWYRNIRLKPLKQ